MTSTLAKLIRRADATHIGTGSFPDRVQSQGTRTHTRDNAQHADFSKGVFTTIQADTKINSHAATTNLIH